jgi:hypothetical protein
MSLDSRTILRRAQKFRLAMREFPPANRFTYQQANSGLYPGAATMKKLIAGLVLFAAVSASALADVPPPIPPHVHAAVSQDVPPPIPPHEV